MAPPRLGHIARVTFCLNRSLGILRLVGLAICHANAVDPTVFNFLSPSDNSTSVPETTGLIVQFAQNLVKGTSGNIRMEKYSDDSTVETITVTSVSVTAVGSTFVTVSLSTLGFGTRYYVFIDANTLKSGSK